MIETNKTQICVFLYSWLAEAEIFLSQTLGLNSALCRK